MKITQEEKERWIEHVKNTRVKTNRYEPSELSKMTYLFLSEEVDRLGSISAVIKLHKCGRNTVHTAIRYRNKMNERNNLPPSGSSVRLGWLKP